MRKFLIGGLACCAVSLSACGSNDESGSKSSSLNEALVAGNGSKYEVVWDFAFDPAALPQDSDLKMLNGDLAQYALDKCVGEGFDENVTQKCDLYVQAEASGTLRGYLFLKETAEGVSFSTATDMIDPREAGGNCFLDFKIDDTGSELNGQVKDARADFKGRVLYNAWENGSGQTLVSQDDGEMDGTSEGAYGVWYIEKKGAFFRIEQERWNYCYKNSEIYMDDVFKRVLTLTLQS